MQTPLATTPGRHDHPPQSAPAVSSRRAQRPVRRVGLLDRAALHLGMALIRWGRRPVSVDLRERATFDAATHKARQEMERARDLQQAMSMTRIR